MLTFEVFAHIMHWNLKANEHPRSALSAPFPTDLYDQITFLCREKCKHCFVFCLVFGVLALE